MTYQPLIVTAHLSSAIERLDPWSPALDALLAYWWLREALGEEEFALGMTGHRASIDADIPVARDTDPSTGHWWFQCSAPVGDVARRFHSHTHRRFDEAEASSRVPERVRTVLTAGGPYKAYRNQHARELVPALAWSCVGDGDEIDRLLRRCANIGRGHTHGYGQVVRWEVTPGDDATLHAARFGRPLPVAFAAQHDVTGPQRIWGVRPPGREPAHQTLCVMPVQS